MAKLSRRAARVAPVLLGVAIGTLVAVLTLATSSAPAIQWPPAQQVEFLGANFTPRTSVTGSERVLPSDCATMLVDVDSTVPTNVWVTPWHTPVDFNGTAPPAPSYYWSGLTPVEHLSTVVTVTNPSAGVALTVLDASYNQSGPASFGFVFSASDCQ